MQAAFAHEDGNSDLAFSSFVLHQQQKQLTRQGRPVSLGSRAFDVLSLLVGKRGQLVTKNELLDSAWPDVVVEENNLQVQVSALRKLLGPDVIATVPGRGYRFTAPVFRAGADAASTRADAGASMGCNCSLAVLALAVKGADHDGGYWCESLAQDILRKLSRSRWLHVIPGNSSLRHQTGQVDHAHVCQQLGVKYLVCGHVHMQGARVRVGVELIDGQRNEMVWTLCHEDSADDLAGLKDAVSSAIVSALEPMCLRHEEKAHNRWPAPAQSLTQPDSWPLLMRARWHFWRSTPEDLAQARHHAQQALHIHADDPRALCLLAFVAMWTIWSGRSTDVRADVEEAQRLALRAVALDDTDACAHFSLGCALSLSGKLAQAMGEQECALSLYPQFAPAAGELARMHLLCGHGAWAHQHVRQACAASPLDPHMSLWLRTRALACFMDGEHEQAVAWAVQALAKRPDWVFNLHLLAACQMAAGQALAARVTLQEASTLGPYALAALQAGHPFASERQLQRLIDCLRQAGWSGE
jgi:DNA-binding winged helix-turn-helix (wHTH) protein/tetratricopeptide (TPR) repeat protein